MGIESAETTLHSRLDGWIATQLFTILIAGLWIRLVKELRRWTMLNLRRLLKFPIHLPLLLNTSLSFSIILQTSLVTKTWFCLFPLSMSLVVDHMQETNLLCRHDFENRSFVLVYGSSCGSLLFQGSREDGRRSLSPFEGQFVCYISLPLLKCII